MILVVEAISRRRVLVASPEHFPRLGVDQNGIAAVYFGRRRPAPARQRRPRGRSERLAGAERQPSTQKQCEKDVRSSKEFQSSNPTASSA